MSRPPVKPVLFALFLLPLSIGFSLTSSHQHTLGVSVAHAGQASFPDLVVSSVSNPPTSIVAGSVQFTVTDTTTNSGDGTADPSTTRYRFSEDTTITSADSLVPGTRSIPSLNKKKSSTGSATIIVPSTFTPGTYYLGACADDTEAITESNETNNCIASTATVQVHPPTTLSAAPTTVSAGTSITATWTQIAAPTSTDWIGLYVPGSANTAYLTFMYVNCSSTPTVAVPAGSCPVSIPFSLPPGTYELRLQWNNGFPTLATSNTFTVTSPPPPAKLAITSANGGANPTAGTGFAVTVQVQGADGTPTIVSSATNVSLSLKTGTGNLGGTLTGTIFANTGQVTITGVTYTKAEGGVVLTATQTSGVSLTPGDSGPFTVNPGAPAVLRFGTQPGNASAGVLLPGPPTVVTEDSVGNLVTSPVSISLTLGNNIVGAVLSGTTNKNTASGIASFDDLSINKSSNGYTLIATATGLTTATSIPFLISPGAATSLAFVTQPNNATTSSAIPGPPTIVVHDSQGNAVTSSSAAITVAIGTNPGGGTIAGTTNKTASSGVATFADLKINQTGNGYTLTATAAGLTGATSSAFNITVGGTVGGTVSEAAGGGAITGATVEALQSGVVKGTGSTNSSGSYSITGLIPGIYDIRADAGGFSPQTQSSITVNAGVISTANFSLSNASPTTGIVYIYDELQRFKSVIDPVGEAATYAFDAVGNLLSITRNNASQTSIIDFNPNSGPVGSTVTIHGTGYSATPNQNTVTINGVAATVVSSTLTQIVISVPAGATTGPIAVTSSAGGATSSTNFTVTGSPLGAPTIANVTPTIGSVGTAITITGTNFDTTAANNNAVRFNPALAAATTATGTTIGTTVPFAARSGKISVTTPGGSAISNQDFFVPPGGFSSSDIEFTGRVTVGGPGLVVPVNTANKVALALFEGIAGQRISVHVTDSTFPVEGITISSATLKILTPNGYELASLSWREGGFLDVKNLPVTGTYTILVDPNGSNTGQATITVYEVPAESQGVITPGGAPVTVVTPVPGQNASLTFSGTAGQQVSLLMGDATYINQGSTISSGSLTILNPDGTQLTTLNWRSPTAFIETQTLPSTGTYKILLNPFDARTGQATLTLYDVPAADQGTITPGSAPVTVVTPVPGQNALLTFSGTAGQQVSLLMSDATYVNQGSTISSGSLTILNPDGTQLTTINWRSPSVFIEPQTLPTTGTYKIVLNPFGTRTGQATLTLYDVPAADQGTITPGGTPVTVVTPIPGQNASLTFSGTAGQQVSLLMSDATYVNQGSTISSGSLTILNPDGTQLTTINWRSPSVFIEPQTLPTTGTYKIVLNPFSTRTGQATLTLYDVPAADQGAITPGGAPVTVVTPVPGQNASLTFSGTAGQQVSLIMTDATYPNSGSFIQSGNLTIFNPDGTPLANVGWRSPSVSMGVQTLPVTGTYKILLDPFGTRTGQATLTLN